MIKTTSLETAKLLKENGFRQDTNLYWNHFDFVLPYSPAPDEDKFYSLDSYKKFEEKLVFAAPTTDEILDELPYDTYILKWSAVYRIKIDNQRFQHVPAFADKSLPEALASMWIFLKREGC